MKTRSEMRPYQGAHQGIAEDDTCNCYIVLRGNKCFYSRRELMREMAAFTGVA